MDHPIFTAAQRGAPGIPRGVVRDVAGGVNIAPPPNINGPPRGGMRGRPGPGFGRGRGAPRGGAPA